ncbi:MAG: TraB/GumN family protein [Deltaproteobacteria bacterium]|nr:TraB/GumN family protein [Deltaproteobacteria bacterium]
MRTFRSTRVILALALIAFGCAGSKPDPKPAPGSAAVVSVTSTPSAGSSAPAPVPSDDPWGKDPPVDPGEPPDATTTKELADKACPIVKAPFYYRVTKSGKTSWLLGTRHLGVPLTKLPPKIKAQVLKSSLVVFETPPGDEAEGTPGDGASLATKLGPQLWTKYTALVGQRTAGAVENQKPSIALLMLMMMYEDKLSALDMEIEQVASAAKIRTGGLETSAFQEQLLEELLDLRMLKATIAGTPDRKTIEKESFEDLAEYCAGTDDVPGSDAKTIKQLTEAGYTDAEIKRLDERLLDERNIAWMPQLEKMFATGNVFVVVGADHLIGKTGVVKMLTDRGFKAERVGP